MAAAAAPAIIYFDNDAPVIKTVTDVCHSIRVVKVDDSSRHAPKIPHGSPELAPFYEKVPADNPYRRFTEIVSRSVGYDPVSGIEAGHIAQLRAWLAETSDNPTCYAIFDWDRTLSKVEGFILPPEPYSIGQIVEWATPLVPDLASKLAELPPITAEHVLEYLCVGAERVAMLRAMFARLVEADVEIVVLTNNPGCKHPSFHELVMALLPAGYAKDPRICSQSHDGNKGAALGADPRFAAVCEHDMYSGGGRHKRRRGGKSSTRRKASSRRRRTHSRK
jgi:hypothetical protein